MKCRLQLIPLIFIILVQLVIAGDHDSPASQTILLYPCDQNYLRIDYRSDNAPGPFKDESGFKGRDIKRGFIPTLPVTPFIRDLSTQELCVKPDKSVIFANNSFKRYPCSRDAAGHIIFRSIPVSAFNGRVEIPYLIDLITYETACSGWIIVRSGWNGILEIDGTKWQLFVIDNLDGQIDSRDTFSIEKPTTDKNRLSPNVHSVPRTLFVGGHAFDLTFKFTQQNRDVVLETTVTEIYPPLGIVNIQAEGCDSIYLQNEDTAIVLHSPAGQIHIPAGQYHLTECLLRSDNSMAAIPVFSRLDRDLLIGTSQQAFFQVGLPLEHYAEVARNKSLLNLTYKLQGQGGEVYTHNSGQPWFAIYKGPIKLAGGQFGFG